MENFELQVLKSTIFKLINFVRQKVAKGGETWEHSAEVYKLQRICTFANIYIYKHVFDSVCVSDACVFVHCEWNSKWSLC